MKKVLRVIITLAVVLIAIPALFTMCEDNVRYSIGDITYDPETNLISWYDNSGANKWLISVNGQKEQKIGAPQYSYDANESTFSVRIEGLFKKQGHEKNPVAFVTFHYLDTVSGLKVEDGAVKWDPVPGATGYDVYNNGDHVTTTSDCYYTIPSGSFNIYVKPTMNGYYYCYPSETVSGAVLAAPQNLRYENGVFKWDAVTNADYYQLKINGQSFTTSDTSYQYDPTGSDIEIEISAGSNAENSYVSAPLKLTCYYLPAVRDFSFSETGDLIWSEIPNADGYNVTINGVETQYLTSPCLTGIIPDTSYTVTVIPTAYLYYTEDAIPYTFEQLSPVTGVTIDHAEVHWDTHERAVRYDVVINGETFSTDTTSLKLSEDQIGEEITVQVYAVGSGENSRSYTAVSQTFVYLTPITTYSFDQNGSLVWPAVNGATQYMVILNDMETQVVTEPVFSNIQLDTQYTVKVVPQCDHSYSVEPEPYTFEKLSPVNNINFAEGKITWDTHSRAESYEVIVNGDVKTTTENFLTLGNVKHSVTIEVFAKGTLPNSRSFTSTKDTYTYLPEVTNIRVEDGILKWSESQGAFGYQLTLSNGSIINVDTNQYSAIIPNQQYVVKIMPVNTTIKSFSYQSAEFIFSILAAPTVTYQQGVFRWQGTNDASGYIFRVTLPDGTVLDESLPHNQFIKQYNFSTPGKYTVSVKLVAKPEIDNLYDSAFSAPVSVIQLNNVTGHDVINNNQSTQSVQIRVNPVEYACGYKVYVNGQEVANTDTDTCMIDLLSLSTDDRETTFTVEIRAIGKTTANEVILDSINTYSFNLVRLATPTGLSISGTTVSWNSVSNAAKYIVFVDGVGYETTTSQYQLTNLSEGNHTITVQAINLDSDLYMPSRHSLALNVQKLAAPADVRIEPAGNELVLKWSQVTGASNYQIKIGSNISDPVRATSYPVSQHANALGAGEGVQVSVYAKGNGSNIIDSEPSITITIAKLNAPTNLGVSGDNIVWNPSEVDNIGATAYELYLNGKVYNTSGTSFPTADIPAGTYAAYVKAIGNKTTTIDSPNSGSVYITKLATITNVQATEGGKVYTWDVVPGATSYRVTVDGVEYYVNEPKFEVNFTEAKTYNISIRAISTAPNTIQGDAYTISQQVRALLTPTYVADADVNNMADNTYTVVNNGSSFTIVAKASGTMPVSYEFYVEGISEIDPDGSYDYVIAGAYEGMPFVIAVKFKYSGFGADGVYYIDSAMSAETTVIYSAIVPSVE